jgi:hypothetical protein
MTVLVIGASHRGLQQLRAIAPAGVDMVDEGLAEPDWVIVATNDQRVEAIASTGLTPFRVVEIPEIASALDESAMASLRGTLAKMSGIGASRPLLSSLGLAIVRPFIRRSVKRTSFETASGSHEFPAPVPRRSGVLKPIPAGRRLDDLLTARERKRVDRFLAQVQRWSADEGA